MQASDRAIRVGGLVCFTIALGLSCSAIGCNEGSGSRPAPFSPEVEKQNQDMMSGGYRAAIYKDRAEKKAAEAAAKKKGM